MRPILAMLDPITFPSAISLLPFKAATTLTNSSGALVAKATKVKPITTFDTRSFNATPTLPRTRNSPPSSKSRKPPIRYNAVKA